MNGRENPMQKTTPNSDSSRQSCLQEQGAHAEEALRRMDILREDFRYLLHEVRTPLTAVINYASALKRQEHSAIERDFLLTIIEDEALRISSTLESFSEAVHADAENWTTNISISPVPVSELCERTANRFRNLASKYTLRISIPSDLPPIRADWHKMELVLRNLIGNALKYSPEGGTVFIAAEERGPKIRILVQDEGIGIPEECLEKIFEESYRAISPECREARGTGLGLTLARRIVEAHGGQIGVHSQPKQGSTFFVDLPAY